MIIYMIKLNTKHTPNTRDYNKRGNHNFPSVDHRHGVLNSYWPRPVTWSVLRPSGYWRMYTLVTLHRH